MSQFSIDLSAQIAKIKGNIDEAARQAVTDVAARIVELSPIGDATLWEKPENKPKGYVGGHFRGNYQLGVGTIPDGTFDTIDTSGKVSMDRIKAAIPIQASGKMYYLVNNLKYAQRLEDGYSTQAPAGMVALTVVEWKNIVDDAANNARNSDSSMTAGFEAYPI